MNMMLPACCYFIRMWLKAQPYLVAYSYSFWIIQFSYTCQNILVYVLTWVYGTTPYERQLPLLVSDALVQNTHDVFASRHHQLVRSLHVSRRGAWWQVLRLAMFPQSGVGTLSAIGEGQLPLLLGLGIATYTSSLNWSLSGDFTVFLGLVTIGDFLFTLGLVTSGDCLVSWFGHFK